MKKYISLILLLALASGSCKKTYLSELALNPNTPAITTPALTLAGALKKTADQTAPASSRVNGFTIYGFYSGYLSWSTGTQPDQAVYLYQFTTSSFDFFTPIYGNLANYQAVINSTTEPNYIAIAKIMIVYNMQLLVDNYDYVPYFDALKGVSVLTPKYDSGTLIYDDLMKQLDVAIDLITKAPATAATPGTSDIVYGATKAQEMANWKIFANTMKLKLAIRQSNVAGKAAALKTAVQATASIGYIKNTATSTTAAGYEANVQPGYLNLNGQQSPIDQAVGFTQTGTVSGSGATYFANSFYVNKLIGNGTRIAPDDLRLFQVYAQSTSAATNPNAANKIEATALGQTQAPQELNVPPVTVPVTPPTLVGVNQSKYSAFLLNPVKSTPIFSASESLFLQSEAVKNGLITGDAEALYNAGVTASFVSLGLTTAQASAYLLLPAYAYPTAGTDAAKESAIIYQKWVALNPYGYFEAFNEYRRTGYPALPISIYPGVTTTVQPARIPYPLVEYNTNAVNVAAAPIADEFTGRIFWAKP